MRTDRARSGEGERRAATSLAPSARRARGSLAMDPSSTRGGSSSSVLTPGYSSPRREERTTVKPPASPGLTRFGETARRAYRGSGWRSATCGLPPMPLDVPGSGVPSRRGARATAGAIAAQVPIATHASLRESSPLRALGSEIRVFQRPPLPPSRGLPTLARRGWERRARVCAQVKPRLETPSAARAFQLARLAVTAPRQTRGTLGRGIK